MASVNKAILVGNLGRDPEIRSLQDGREVASLSLATSESWKDRHSGEKRERTEWHRVVIFSEGLVRVVKEYLSKGMRVYVEGQIQTRKYTDSQSVERYTTEIVLQSFGSKLVLLDRAQHRDDRGQDAPAPARTANDLDDEIPF